MTDMSKMADVTQQRSYRIDVIFKWSNILFLIRKWSSWDSWRGFVFIKEIQFHKHVRCIQQCFVRRSQYFISHSNDLCDCKTKISFIRLRKHKNVQQNVKVFISKTKKCLLLNLNANNLERFSTYATVFVFATDMFRISWWILKNNNAAIKWMCKQSKSINLIRSIHCSKSHIRSQISVKYSISRLSENNEDHHHSKKKALPFCVHLKLIDPNLKCDKENLPLRFFEWFIFGQKLF